MRILLLCWRDTTHPQGGGSERYLEHIAKYLVASGHEVIFRTARHTDASRSAVRDGVEYQYAGGKYSVYVLAAVAQLMGRLGIGRLRGVDVVVDTQNGIPFFARVFSGVPTILLTTIVIAGSGMWLVRLLRAWAGLLSRRCPRGCIGVCGM
ncbi:glycosyltransferase [Corynebacterium diphtheriae]|uniref:glycosyltransferase n=1 Tax=Corynebacterium diphtheriae TaxID=1717 RepID=UPI000246946C|nr:glycosyltransferase [Corynebacterium diphtheriae]AEX70783.1 hypothetical protein CDPW8_2140 [Corynebacterium diphtheriae PW8]UEB38375.1 glycosyltransferase [Corynebacterium diphtheriae]WLF42403.1 glycosyltransferase [Corynebacterium diphtheriae]CAB0619249.1 hypothetical protein CIP107554_02146 [Corynebacterium diphtheriae]SUY76182.1 predicted glycosyltransferase [Corynebacterium diphtheriae bv. mitis]